MFEHQRFLQRLTSGILDRGYRTEIEEEVMDHLECAAAELEAAGVPRDEALRRAIAAFGDPEGIGHLLQKTGKGAKTIMMKRLGGISAMLGGLLVLLLTTEGEVPGWLERQMLRLFSNMDTAGAVIFLSAMAFCIIGLLTVQTLHHGSRVSKAVMLAVPSAAGVFALTGVLVQEWSLFMAGFVCMGLGLSIAGYHLVRRGERPWSVLGGVALIAGFVPGIPYLNSVMNPAGVWAFAFHGLAWIGLGTWLVAARPLDPGTGHRMA